MKSLCGIDESRTADCDQPDARRSSCGICVRRPCFRPMVSEERRVGCHAGTVGVPRRRGALGGVALGLAALGLPAGGARRCRAARRSPLCRLRARRARRRRPGARSPNGWSLRRTSSPGRSYDKRFLRRMCLVHVQNQDFCAPRDGRSRPTLAAARERKEHPTSGWRGAVPSRVNWPFRFSGG